MLFSLIRSGASAREIIIQLLLTLPIIIMSLTLHECAHGWAAMKCGDNTARNLGRLTINPLQHLDPIGFTCMLLFGIGWAKPVPINTRNFKNPRRGTALTAAAGPLANLTVAFAVALIQVMFETVAGVDAITDTIWMYVLWLFLYLTVEMNVYLAVFNLLPVPPFDGSRIFFIFMPVKWYFKIMKYERYIQMALLLLLWLDPLGLISGLLSLITNLFLTLIYGIISLVPFLG